MVQAFIPGHEFLWKPPDVWHVMLREFSTHRALLPDQFYCLQSQWYHKIWFVGCLNATAWGISDSMLSRLKDSRSPNDHSTMQMTAVIIHQRSSVRHAHKPKPTYVNFVEKGLPLVHGACITLRRQLKNNTIKMDKLLWNMMSIWPITWGLTKVKNCWTIE